EEGTFTVTITVNDTGDSLSGSATSQVTISDPAVAAASANISGTAGSLFNGTVATFTDPGGLEPNTSDPNPTTLSGHYTATINWGDGSATTTGTLTQSGNTVSV